MASSKPIVFWDSHSRAHQVRLELDPEDARTVAYALGLHDAAAQEILEAAEDAERRDNHG